MLHYISAVNTGMLTPAGPPRISRNVYSVARHGEFPFLDPHFIIRADGSKQVGPNAVLVSGPEAYHGAGGAWRFLRMLAAGPLGPKIALFFNCEFLTLVADEWTSSVSKSAMCSRVRKLIPEMSKEMLTSPGTSGVRNSLVGKEGFVSEAITLKGPRSVHALNYNSPGATGTPVFAVGMIRGM